MCCRQTCFGKLTESAYGHMAHGRYMMMLVEGGIYTDR